MPSLYANLLDSAAPKATISGAPVKYEFKPQSEAAQQEEQKRAADAALRFQPIKRPQIVQKPKARPVPSSSSLDKLPLDRKAPPTVAPTTTSIEKWTAEDDFDPYAADYNRRKEEEKRRSRWANKKRKKKKEAAREVNFDEIYDPQFPIRLDDYKGSDEQAQAESDWKQKLHEHQFRRRQPSHYSSAEDGEENLTARRSFAPPANYNFAPPAIDDPSIASAVDVDSAARDDEDDYEPPQVIALANESGSVPRKPSVDPWTDRHAHQPLAPNLASASAPPPPPPSISADIQPPPPAQRPGVISAAPVRYEAPEAASAPIVDEDMEDVEVQGGLGFAQQAGYGEGVEAEEEQSTDDAPRSNRPGQRGFAKRLLQKYGWKEGQGLGAEGSGITTILRHQAEKRKKRSDAEGGGWAQPAAMGRIVGGKKRKTDESAEDQWSIVAKFEGMLNGLDLDHAIQEQDLMQQIGDKMAGFGHVERLFIDRAKLGVEPVFVKFTSALSAFRAVQASNGIDFMGNGRVVKSGFHDADKFEAGDYD